MPAPLIFSGTAVAMVEGLAASVPSSVWMEKAKTGVGVGFVGLETDPEAHPVAGSRPTAPTHPGPSPCYPAARPRHRWSMSVMRTSGTADPAAMAAWPKSSRVR